MLFDYKNVTGTGVDEFLGRATSPPASAPALRVTGRTDDRLRPPEHIYPCLITLLEFNIIDFVSSLRTITGPPSLVSKRFMTNL